MAEAREIPAGTYELKLGETFQDRGAKSTYHTLRFDFKPKSLASEAETYIAFGGNNEVQVAVPGDSDALTVYKGSQKPARAEKECLLFFDHNSGELRLEKLSSNMSVKKTRDVDESTANVLRSEIQRLRGNQMRKVSDKSSDDEEMSDDKTSSGSLSSTTSDSGESDSDFENSKVEKESSLNMAGGSGDQPMKPVESSSDDEEEMNDSGSGDDDDLQDVLEQQLNSDSMPVIGNTAPPPSSEKTQYHAPSKPSSYASSTNHNHHSKMLLDDDLQLSESSDDD
ncbi:hypothetical protein AB6A40_000944 [Gnathostoma spinigerum]|uniref:Ell-associated factor Eaf n=1 Tax=Gnathostoma spinigerum TaxID=75299 RepID=A0ABD6ED45_9BILA